MNQHGQSRRRFLTGAAVAATTAVLPRVVHAESSAMKAARGITGEPSLVPSARNTAPDYYCTWNAQGFVVSYENALVQADAMIEANLFGNGPNQNWLGFFPDACGDLYFVLDDAFDMPLGGGRSHPMRGSLELDTERFPSYRGTPAQRLAQLNRDIRAGGWRGAGLWVLSAPARARIDPNVNDEAYWAERLDWSRQAGIDYWKVDWGRYNHREIWRLNQWARRHNPAVWIEHGAFSRDGSRIWLADKIAVLRTYDVHPSHSVGVTIRRIAGILRHRREDRASAGLINCEDEVYIGAGLGCAYGVMRHPLTGDMPNGKPDKFFTTEARNLKRRIDEVTRAVRWHRIAHPFGVTEHELVDTDEFRESPRADGVPSRVARGGLKLPKVVISDGLAVPYVLCSRHPDGEIAIATIPRRTSAGEVTHPAEITLDVGAIDRPVGIFGRYGSLTLITTGNLAGKRILAQDLAGDTPVDITDQLEVEGERLTIPGSVIERVGLMSAKPDDISDPGLVLAVEGLTRYIAKKAMTPHNFDAVPPRPLPLAEPSGALRIHRALWGSVTGGTDVADLLTGMVKDGGLKVDAIPEVLGDDGSERLHQRLEVEYTCDGKAVIALAVYGDLLIIRPDGSYRADRVNR